MDVVLGVRIVLCCPLLSTFTFLAFYFVLSSHCCHAVVIHPTSFLVALFFPHMFSLYAHDFLGAVFTPPVGYSRPLSAVNDPSVTIAFEFLKIIP